MAELSVTLQTSDEKIKASEEIEKYSKRKKDDKTKMGAKLKTVRFVEPEPIIYKPSNDRKYPTRVFVSSTQKFAKNLEKLKREIYDAIRETKGVWCTDVVSLYWKHTGKYLDLAAFRFYNILSLLRCMQDQLVITRSESYGNMWVCDAKNPLPPPKMKEPKQLLEPEPEPVNAVPWWDPCPPEPPDRTALEEDALPGIPFAPDVFPEDCIQPGGTIRNMELPELDSDYLDMNVFVTGFYSPSHVWLRFSGKQYNDAIENMLDDMTQYYEDGDGVSRRLGYAAMKVGLYCAAFHQYWHRALIVRIVDTDHAKVLLVDQGMVLKLSIEDMKPLCVHWAEALPAQAVRARMVGVRPPDGAQLWPRFSCYRFVDQTRGLALIARILAVDKAERVLNVYLRNHSTKQRIKRKLVITEGIDHGVELIRAGYAEPEPKFSTEGGERISYYYPSFDALESGATPSFQELDELSKQGFEPEDVPSFIEHVPPLEPIRCPTPTHLTDDIEDFHTIDGPISFDHTTLDNAPSYNAPSDNTPSHNAPSYNAPSDNTPSHNAPSYNASLDNTLSDNALSYNASLDNTLSDNASLDNTLSDNALSYNASLNNTLSDNAPSYNASLDNTLSDNAPSYNASLNNTLSDNAPSYNAPLDNTPSDNVLSDNSPSNAPVTSRLVAVARASGTMKSSFVTDAKASDIAKSSVVKGATTSGPVKSVLVAYATTSNSVISGPKTGATTSGPVTKSLVKGAKPSGPVKSDAESSATANLVDSVIRRRNKKSRKVATRK